MKSERDTLIYLQPLLNELAHVFRHWQLSTSKREIFWRQCYLRLDEIIRIAQKGQNRLALPPAHTFLKQHRRLFQDYLCQLGRSEEHPELEEQLADFFSQEPSSLSEEECRKLLSRLDYPTAIDYFQTHFDLWTHELEQVHALQQWIERSWQYDHHNGMSVLLFLLYEKRTTLFFQLDSVFVESKLPLVLKLDIKRHRQEVNAIPGDDDYMWFFTDTWTASDTLRENLWAGCTALFNQQNANDVPQRLLQTLIALKNTSWNEDRQLKTYSLLEQFFLPLLSNTTDLLQWLRFMPEQKRQAFGEQLCLKFSNLSSYDFVTLCLILSEIKEKSRLEKLILEVLTSGTYTISFRSGLDIDSYLCYIPSISVRRQVWWRYYATLSEHSRLHIAYLSIFSMLCNEETLEEEVRDLYKMLEPDMLNSLVLAASNGIRIEIDWIISALSVIPVDRKAIFFKLTFKQYLGQKNQSYTQDLYQLLLFLKQQPFNQWCRISVVLIELFHSITSAKDFIWVYGELSDPVEIKAFIAHMKPQQFALLRSELSAIIALPIDKRRLLYASLHQHSVRLVNSLEDFDLIRNQPEEIKHRFLQTFSEQLTTQIFKGATSVVAQRLAKILERKTHQNQQIFLRELCLFSPIDVIHFYYSNVDGIPGVIHYVSLYHFYLSLRDLSSFELASDFINALIHQSEQGLRLALSRLIANAQAQIQSDCWRYFQPSPLSELAIMIAQLDAHWLDSVRKSLGFAVKDFQIIRKQITTQIKNAKNGEVQVNGDDMELRQCI